MQHDVPAGLDMERRVELGIDREQHARAQAAQLRPAAGQRDREAQLVGRAGDDPAGRRRLEAFGRAGRGRGATPGAAAHAALAARGVAASRRSPQAITASSSRSRSASVVRWLVRLTRIARPPGSRTVEGAAMPLSCRSATISPLRRSAAGGSSARRAQAKADDVERDRRHQLQPRLLEHAGREVDGLAAVVGDRGAEPPRAVLLEREPHLERAKAARQLGPEVAGPGLAAGEPARGALEIAGLEREGGAVQLAAAHQHAAGVVLDVEPLVEVEGQRIGTLDAVEQRPMGGAEDRERAERAIDVQPEVVLRRRCARAPRGRRSRRC